MGVAYRKDELISASKAARSFGQVLSDLAKSKKKRMVIVKNNRLEAVILPIQEYEHLTELAEWAEHIEIHEMIRKRKGKNSGKRFSLDAVIKEEGLVL